MSVRLGVAIPAIIGGLVGLVLFQHHSQSPVYAQAQPASSSQNPAAEIKHLPVAHTYDAGGAGTISALSIERHGNTYPFVTHLSGNVEIKMGGFILHADEAVYNEGTGEIEAHGTVVVKPYPRPGKK